MRLAIAVAMIGLSALGAHAEGACFRSVAEASQQVGLRDAAGFRVVEARRDPYSGVNWVTVVSCAHPERPGAVVRGTAAKAVTALVTAGSEVRLLRNGASMRIELMGVAMGSGAVGERVKVRLRGGLNETQDRFVAGLVKADGTLELED